MARDLKRAREAAATPPPEQPKVHAAYYLDAALVGDLQELVAKLKRKARSAGKPLPTMSSVIEDALRAEIAKYPKDTES